MYVKPLDVNNKGKVIGPVTRSWETWSVWSYHGMTTIVNTDIGNPSKGDEISMICPSSSDSHKRRTHSRMNLCQWAHGIVSYFFNPHPEYHMITVLIRYIHSFGFYLQVF